MSNFVINGLLQSRNPLLTFRRFRGKINIQRPRAPHYERARVLEVIKPVYKRPEFNAPCIEAQKANETKKLDNPYETIIAREARNWFDHSNLVAFLHVNSIRQEDMFKAQVALHRHNISVKVYGKSIMRKALAGTKFETILPLFEAKTAIVFAPDPQKIKQVLGVLKKTPQLVLLAGIVEGRLLSRNEFVAYATMPDLTTTRAQLAAVLDSAGGFVVLEIGCSHLNFKAFESSKDDEHLRPQKELFAIERCICIGRIHHFSLSLLRRSHSIGSGREFSFLMRRWRRHDQDDEIARAGWHYYF